jgi:hypothetical protein
LVNPDRAEFEWIYQPADFFEVPYHHANTDYDLVVADGRVSVTLRVPQDPVDPQLDRRIGTHVADIFAVRQLEVHRKYDLEGPRVYQHAGARKNVAIRVGAAFAVASAGRADFIVRDAAGKVVRDTKAERIAQHTLLLDAITPRLVHSSALRGVLMSYSRAVTDPGNEFVHLYEIRDALSKHYGGEDTARAALNISRTEWQRLGLLANVEPLEEGRHRGKHVAGRRTATAAELEEARSIVQRWIIAFSKAV